MDINEYLDQQFRFKIGDILIHRAGLIVPTSGTTDVHLGQYPFHTRLFVTERLLQQCHGGIQKFYKLVAVDHNGQVQASMNSSEIELELFPQDRVDRGF